MFILLALAVMCIVVLIDALDALRHRRGVNRFGVFVVMLSAVVFMAVMLFDERMWR